MSTVDKQDRALPLLNQRLVGKHLEIALRGLDANHVFINFVPSLVGPIVAPLRCNNSRASPGKIRLDPLLIIRVNVQRSSF
jgi:hypothetical protein